MKIGAAILFLCGFLALANAQEHSPGRPGDPASIGLPPGTRAPAFTSRDQFGHEQSNETLRGSSGTVLLFFRSADW